MPLVEINNPRMELKKCNSIPSVPYIIGNGLFFDGINDFTQTPTIFAGTVMSFSVWVKFNSFKSFDIISASNAGSTYMLGYADALKTLYINYGGIFGGFELATPLLTNIIYNITVTRNGNEHRLYLNGFLVDTLNIISGSGSIFLFFGKDFTNFAFSNITLFDFKIFTTFLSDIYVLYLYSLKIPLAILGNLVFNTPFEVLEKISGVVYTPDLTNSFNSVLGGYLVGAKGIVDQNGNDIQVVP